MVLFAVGWVLSTSEGRPAGLTLSWILLFIFVPGIGVGLYVLLGYRGFRLRRRLARLGLGLRPAGRGLADASIPFAETFRLAEALTRVPVQSASRLEVLDEAFQTYGALADAIRGARTRVHLEFYIFQPDETGESFRELLIERARSGVRCRLLVDAMGSYRLTRAFLRPLEEAGVEVALFAPVRLTRLWSLHYRNHRKLAVIDGKIGFIGSQNIGNEYLGWKNRNRSWRDIQLKFEGDAVLELERIFADDWKLATDMDIQGSSVDPGPAVAPPGARSELALIPTGPDERAHALEMLICDALVRAKTEVLLATPYFVPSLPVQLALVGAAKRGVEIRVLLPARSDQWVVDLAGRALLSRLIESGVRVFEHSKNFLHAKVLVVDRSCALIGSANMDERSYRLNWECSALVSDQATLVHLHEVLSAIGRDSGELTLKTLQDGFFKRVMLGVARLAAPWL